VSAAIAIVEGIPHSGGPTKESDVVKLNDAALKKISAPLPIDTSRTEAQQVDDMMKELKKRGITPTRAGVLKTIREMNKKAGK
jgi:hypothetical protein